ncbi:hypothetical protein ABIA20_002868 [Sinorhizobium fredii]
MRDLISRTRSGPDASAAAQPSACFCGRLDLRPRMSPTNKLNMLGAEQVADRRARRRALREPQDDQPAQTPGPGSHLCAERPLEHRQYRAGRRRRQAAVARPAGTVGRHGAEDRGADRSAPAAAEGGIEADHRAHGRCSSDVSHEIRPSIRRTGIPPDSIHPSRAAGFWAPRVVTSVHGDR